MSQQPTQLTGSFYCTCGASWKFGRATADVLRDLRAVWESEHSGPGHEPCSRAEAAKERRKAEAKGRKS